MITTITDKEDKIINVCGGNVILKVSKQEALTLIQSLSTQLAKDNPNCNRLESYDTNQNYVTIIATDD